VPKGFAHGFAVLSNTAEISYKCDALYHKKSERGLIYNDTSLGINWQIPESKIILSDKDALLPRLQECRSSFVFKESANTLLPGKQAVPLTYLV
ncbi:dTDP-4-dehydrorhamnose 3,5-epimerase family protein, partial [Ferruginibacter sp.]